jgi:hypothetical protein
MKVKSLTPFVMSRRAPTCTAQGETFAQGNEVFTLLLPQDEGYLRQDYCGRCWKNEQHKPPLEKGSIHWRTIIPPKVEVTKPALDSDQKALQLLKDALAQQENDLAYVLALYLERRDLLCSCRIVGEDAKLFSFYEIASNGEVLRVPKVDLTGLQTAMLQQTLLARLDVAENKNTDDQPNPQSEEEKGNNNSN